MGLLWFQSNPIGSEGLRNGRGLGRPPERLNAKELPGRMGAVESFNPFVAMPRQWFVANEFVEDAEAIRGI
jgi:hypothetical protein